MAARGGGVIKLAQWGPYIGSSKSSFPDSAYRMHLGEYQLSLPTGSASPMRRIIVHHDYNQKTSVADIALVQLTEPVTFTDTIRPIALP
ncbi:unnamed protein product, partial [Lepidochelys olivacea]